MEDILVNIQVDCESTQRSIDDPGLGERAIRGLGEILAGGVDVGARDLAGPVVAAAVRRDDDIAFA